MQREGRHILRRPSGAQSGRALDGLIRPISVRAFVLERRQIAERGMAAVGIVKAFDKILP